MSFKSFCLRAQDIILNILRVWWRPIASIGLAVATWVNLVLIPLVKWEVPDLAAAAAFVTALTAAFAVRAWEKWQGSEDPPTPLEETE